jgi:hypothetical protein
MSSLEPGVQALFLEGRQLRLPSSIAAVVMEVAKFVLTSSIHLT